jgi:broad specificity phosphatase PhoE
LTRLAGLAGAVAIVTHRAICKILVLSLLHMGNEHFWAMKYDPGSITLLEGDDARRTLIFSNDTCHQRDVHSGVRYRDF